MLPCDGCAYRAEIPGNAHSKCRAKWEAGPVFAMIEAVSPGARRWFMFPLNYDPTWGPNECPHRSETMDPEQVRDENPLEELISLLGHRAL